MVKQHLVHMAWALILIGMLGIVPGAAVETSRPDATANDSVLAGPDHPSRTTIWSILQQQFESRSRSRRDDCPGRRVRDLSINLRSADLLDAECILLQGTRRPPSYLYTRLDAIPGLEVAYQSDRYRNVIASLPGKGAASDTVVIVGAHYDSMSSDSDDGSGSDR